MPAIPNAKLYQQMVEQVRDYAIFLLDTEGNIVSWNAGAAALKQYAPDEIIGKHFSVFYTAADVARQWPAQELKRAMTEGRIEDEGWRVKKDGSRFWANVVITALRDEAGALLGYSKITRDLSERKSQEERMRLSEERFRLLVEGVQDYAIYMLSPEGIVSSWNLGARRIKGYEAAEIIGSHFSRFYAAEDIEKGKPWAELAIARERGRAEDEGWRVRKDGSRFWARVVLAALHDSEGRPQGFAKVTQDLTERRHAEALQLSASNITDFLAVLAHELRNPLAPIRNAVQVQGMLAPGDPGHEAARRIIDRQSGQLARIVDDLLDVGRITKGIMAVEKKPTDLAAIVERAVETSRSAVDAGRHVLSVDLPAERLLVDSDELRMAQALTNIINNAARYTDPGGAIFVKVFRSERDRRQVCVSVRDTGRGIAPALLESIFGMFVQGKDPLNRPAAGLGVGLALARSIVEIHHGTVVALSDGPGKGAEFIVSLPLIASLPAALPAAPRQAAAPVSADSLRVLVVDDNTDAAAMLGSLLRKHGHQVLAVHDGPEALLSYEGFRPEIVLLDLGMPGMNGMEVVRKLRERFRGPYPLMVAVTGWGKAEDQARSKAAGFDLHLVKPVEERQLLEIIGTHSRLIH